MKPLERNISILEHIAMTLLPRKSLGKFCRRVFQT